MLDTIKYEVLGRPLELAKTHDFCASGRPALTVVMIHGIASDSSTFDKALTYLEGTTSMKDVRFVCFDLLGAGKSYASDALDYSYSEQVEALHNATLKLRLQTPLVIVGHSMGTLIATRYANKYKKSVRKLVLVSAPVFTEVDLENPAFDIAMKMFEKAVSVKNPEITESKAFRGSMKNIVLNKKNYKNLAEVKTPAVMIYGELDEIIGLHNYPRILKENAKYLTAVKTPGKHGVSHDKYGKILGAIEEVLGEVTKVGDAN